MTKPQRKLWNTQKEDKFQVSTNWNDKVVCRYINVGPKKNLRKKKGIKRTLHNKFINENDRKTICVPNKTVVWYTKQIFRIVNYNKFVITEFELAIISNIEHVEKV